MQQVKKIPNHFTNDRDQIGMPSSLGKLVKKLPVKVPFYQRCLESICWTRGMIAPALPGFAAVHSQ
jgi:hypothetical protein